MAPPILTTRAAASALGFKGANVKDKPLHVEDLFSSYVYTGQGLTTDTLNNGINL